MSNTNATGYTLTVHASNGLTFTAILRIADNGVWAIEADALKAYMTRDQYNEWLADVWALPAIRAHRAGYVR